MSGKLPRITPGQIIRVLEKAGFTQTRQSGSHRIYRNAAGRRATVAYHKKILHPKVLQRILEDADMSVDELRKLL